MLRSSALFFIAVCALAQFAPPGKERSFFNLNDRPAGPKLQFNAVVEPPLAHPADLKLGWGVFYTQMAGHDVWHRFVYDTVHRQYFGYDLIVDPPEIDLLTNQPRDRSQYHQYRVTFAPLSMTPDQIEQRGLSLVALPKYPDPQMLGPGDEIAVDLLVSKPGGRRKVVDHIQIAPFEGLPALRPFTNRVAFFQADQEPVREIYENFGRVTGIHVSFDPTSFDKPSDATPTFNIEMMDVPTPERALNMIAVTTHTFWKPSLGNSILVMKDVPRPTSIGDPKDYTIDDGPLKFDFIGEVLINGQRFTGPTFFVTGDRNGVTPWFCFPDKGRFILSLVPHAGFAKAGEIRDNAISFLLKGEKYEITMNSPVVEAGGAWNLYVFHDSSYQLDDTVRADLPTGLGRSHAPMVIGTTDRLENLPVPRRVQY